MPNQTLQGNTDLALTSGALKVPATLSLNAPSQKTESSEEDVSLIGTMSALSQVTTLTTESTAVPTEASPSTAAVDTTADDDTATDLDYSDELLFDFSTAQPTSGGGIIGGSVVGIASQSLLKEQSALLQMSINWLEFSATNNESQGIFAMTQNRQAIDAANRNFNAGMLQAGSMFAGAGCAGIAAGSSFFGDSAKTTNEMKVKETEINESKARLEALDVAKPTSIAGGGSGPPPLELELKAARKEVIQKSFKENNGVITDKDIVAAEKTYGDRSTDPAEFKKSFKASFDTDEIRDPTTGKINLKTKTDVATGEKKLDNEEVGDALHDMPKDDKDATRKELKTHIENLETQIGGMQQKLASNMNQNNLYWKEIAGQGIQAILKVPQTMQEKRAALKQADSQLSGTIQGQLANLVGSANSMASAMYSQAMSTMQGTMDALRRAANPN